ncbi:hypothetical protein DIPPA_07026 [Diplonema papillatum]|nr:hypothetical protein DIPPA_19006 [Diplonema papillatum]KAJ9445362.1 hypothetical protein DIPPA_07026 [Diplonema papillatum]
MASYSAIVWTLAALCVGCYAQSCSFPETPASEQPQCPFATWKENNTADTRWCYECRWCPFRESTCCEKEDEVTLLKHINVSGSDDWSCFITIAHFQICGKCSPESKRYTVYNVERYLNYAPDPECLSINVCEEACGYIYKRCQNTAKIDGSPVINSTLYPTKAAFCSYAREHSDNCYNAAAVDGPFLVLLLASLGLLLAVLS